MAISFISDYTAATLAKEVDGADRPVYPLTSSELVKYNDNTVKDVLDNLNNADECKESSKTYFNLTFTGPGASTSDSDLITDIFNKIDTNYTGTGIYKLTMIFNITAYSIPNGHYAIDYYGSSNTATCPSRIIMCDLSTGITYTAARGDTVLTTIGGEHIIAIEETT